MDALPSGIEWHAFRIFLIKGLDPKVILDTWSMSDLAKANAVLDLEAAIKDDANKE